MYRLSSVSLESTTGMATTTPLIENFDQIRKRKRAARIVEHSGVVLHKTTT